MGLMRRTPQLSLGQDNWAAQPSGTAGGTTVTAGSANVKGSYATLIASTNYEICGLTIVPANNNAVTAVQNMLIDIAVGAAASEVVIASNLMLNQATSLSSNAYPIVFLALHVPKGARISARCQSNTGAATVNLMLRLHGGGDRAPWPVFQGVETIGADTTDSGGQLHTVGNSGAYSAWANLGASSSRAFKAIMPIMQQGSDTIMTNLMHYLEIGIASVAVAKYMTQSNTGEGTGSIVPNVPTYRPFPSGTQFMLRGTASGVADTDYDFGLLGFY